MRHTLFIVFLLVITCSNAQNVDQFKKDIDTLCSPQLHGRGYVNDGDYLAAKYLAGEFKKNGLLSFNNSYYQEFPIPVNTFPKSPKLSLGKKELTLGKEFIAHAYSGEGKGTFKVLHLVEKHLSTSDNLEKFLLQKKFKSRVVFSSSLLIGKIRKEYPELYPKLFTCKGLIQSCPKLTAIMSQKPTTIPMFLVTENSISKKVKKVTFEVEPNFLADRKSVNVIGYLKGTTYPDSAIFLGAHYDHLGRMGEIYFAGANDNASGTAMTLALMRYYAQNPPKYTIIFCGFSGEEVGLIGSKFYCENPLFPLEKTKFMISLDLFGSGSTGMTVVNSTAFTKEFELLKKINQKDDLLPTIKGRKPTANSDHYFFYKNNVRSFFFYTMGSIKAYHDINDLPSIIEYDWHDRVFLLLQRFVSAL